MRKGLEIGGAVAAIVLIAFGAVAIAMGISGNRTVKDSIAQEGIVGTPDMAPATIEAEVEEAGELPSCDVAGRRNPSWRSAAAPKAKSWR